MSVKQKIQLIDPAIIEEFEAKARECDLWIVPSVTENHIFVFDRLDNHNRFTIYADGTIDSHHSRVSNDDEVSRYIRRFELAQALRYEVLRSVRLVRGSKT